MKPTAEKFRRGVEGILTTDIVSLLSIAKPEVTATTFVTLTTDACK